MHKGKPLNKQGISTILQQEIGKKYNIPMGIQQLGHLCTMFVTIDQPVDPRLLKDIAYKMGTSNYNNVLIKNYSYFKKAVDTGTD